MSDSESDDWENEIIVEADKPIIETADSSESSCDEEPAETAAQVTETVTMVESQEKVGSMASPQPKPRRKRFIPKYEVEGVTTLVLGEETQLQIEICIGTDVTSQHPWKFVSKEKILATIELNGELSEFFALKEQIEQYEEELILLGYIADESKDEDEFYVCYTIDAKNHCKEQSDKYIRRQQKKLEKAVQKKPRPWSCLGSDMEIKDILPVNTRALMEIEIKTKFPTVYQPDKFKVRDTNSVRDGFIELTPYRTKYNNIFRRRVDASVQVAASRVSSYAQTVLRYPKNMWTQSIAEALGKVEDDFKGGGDATIEGLEDNDDDESSEDEQDAKKNKDIADDPGVARYKAALRRMRRPSYIKLLNGFMSEKKTEMDSIVELNTVMDMYCNDYPKLVAKNVFDTYDSMTFEDYICFTDIRAKDKYVSCAAFHPMWTGIIAVCYTDGSPSVMKGGETKIDPIQRAVYGLNPVMIWSHIDSLLPKLYLESPREVKFLSFCPFDENILVGGCVNGQIIVWDLTKKLENVEKIEVLSEIRERYRIAMNAHMGWMKNIQDNAVVQYTALSNLLTSHYGPVTYIKWLSPNFAITPTGKLNMAENKSLMFLTGSEDGNILVWNLSITNVVLFEDKKVKKSKRILRRPSGLLLDVSPLKVLDRFLQPCFKIILGRVGLPFTLPLQCFGINSPIVKYTYTPKSSGTGRKYFNCEIISQTEEELSNVLYCGSMHGEMRKVTWEGHDINTGEVVNSKYCDIKFCTFIHDGIITACLKNPFIKNFTLTVGGKIFAIWHDEISVRPLIWKKRPCCLTDASWSTYKASILFITTSEGSLETWDLLLRSDEPISSQTLSGTMLTGVSLHSLPLAKNIIGVSDENGSFRMLLVPPIFMIESPTYTDRMRAMINRELKVMKCFIKWQDIWVQNNQHVLQEIRRKEGALLAQKEEQKRREKEEEEKRLEEEAEARRLLKMRVLGPEEKWQLIIYKLIERTIAVKKRINRAELIEQERPLRELEAQRLEKERRMLEIMKFQNEIFNDTVAILFPEAIKKQEKVEKTSFLTGNKEALKKEYLEDYEYFATEAIKMVQTHPYHVNFSWEATLAEGKERRQALNVYEDYIHIHKNRLVEELKEPKEKISVKPIKVVKSEESIE